MPSFYDEVYRLVKQVPCGRVTTYGTIAWLIGSPMAARAVGYALRALPPDSDVPWWRVINAQGKISPRAIGLREPDSQAIRLGQEGLLFDSEGRFDLKRFGWPGQDETAIISKNRNE